MQEFKINKVFFGGRGEIRTLGGVAPTPVFKTGALNHSTTLPQDFHIGFWTDIILFEKNKKIKCFFIQNKL